jgi:cytochrome c6
VLYKTEVYSLRVCKRGGKVVKKLSVKTTFVTLTTFAAALCLFLAPGAWAKGNAKAGKATYNAKCAMCHSMDGSGNSPMGKTMKVPDLRSKAVQSKSDAELASIIENGKGMMPKYGSQLSKQQVSDLVAYIRELAKK